MSYTIDTTSYDKHAKYPIGHGYGIRPHQPTTIVVHSTEGKTGQTLESAASYLYRSPDVSSDFLLGKGSEIIQFLDSGRFQAWHAGGYQGDGIWTAQAAYSNPNSIGVECLHAKGEPWPPVQLDTLAWLLEYLTARYVIPVTSIETHGFVAIRGPYDRKKDPTDWPHGEFIAWRDARLLDAPAYVPYRIIAPCAIVTSRSGAAPLAGGPDNGMTWLEPGNIINVGDLTDGWYWVSDKPDLPPGAGFILQCYAVPA